MSVGAYGTVAYGTGPYGSGGADPPAGQTDPTTAVEVAFTTEPGAAVPNWVDIGDFLGGNVNRGRSQELDRFSAGRMQATLPNEDRRFDPTHTGSPYYPYVLPMRRVRIRSTLNGTTYSVFTGYADGWEQAYQHPSVATAILTATDAFKVLANIDLPSSAYATEVLADAPAHWWRLGEPTGSTTIADSGTRPVTGTINGTTALFNQAGLVSREPNTSVKTSVATRFDIPLAGAIPSGQATFTIEAVVQSDAATNTATSRIYSQGDVVLGLQNQSLSPVFFFAIGSSSIQSTTTYDDLRAHHVVATYDNGTMRLYVDGSLQASGSAATAPALGGPAFIAQGNPTHAAYYQEVAVYDQVVSAARITSHQSTVATPWNGDLSGARINRILDAAGWPATDRQIDAGVAVLQSADLGGTVLSALQKVEETEQGRLFVTADGMVRFIARDSLAKAPYNTSQATFGDSGTELEYADLTYRYDDQTIVNEVRVSRLDGTTQVASNATSQSRYLKRVRTVDGLLHNSDATSLEMAYWILNRYKDPLLRVTGMKLEPDAGNQATHYPQVFGRELADRITARRRPQAVGSAIDQAVAIEGIAHQFSAKRWGTSWNLSPLDAAAIGLWDDPTALWDSAKWSV